MTASKVLTVSVSVFRGWISWCFSLSIFFISPAAPDLELILFPLWYWPIMNAHTKQQQDKVFQTDFTDSQNPPAPFAHLLALKITCWPHTPISIRSEEEKKKVRCECWFLKMKRLRVRVWVRVKLKESSFYWKCIQTQCWSNTRSRTFICSLWLEEEKQTNFA